MAPNTAAIATAIANLSVTGVTFKNVTAIPKVVRETDCPIFFPDPAEWFRSMQTDGNITLNSMANQGDVTRVLRYLYLHKSSTAANEISTNYAAMAANVDLIYNAIWNLDTGAATVSSISISQFGEIEAPRQGQLRNVFFGCFFDITFMEIVTK